MDARRSRRGSTWARRAVLSSLLLTAACGGGEEPATPGFSGDTITLGVLTPLGDEIAVIGAPLAAGLRTYFDAVNARGGVRGRLPVRLLVEDVTYANPTSTIEKYRKIRDRIAMLAMVVGTDHVDTLLPLLEQDTVVAAPTTFDAEWVREPQLLPWGTPYQIATINGLAFYRIEGGGAGRSICAVVLETGYGEAGLEGLEFASKAMGFEVAATVRVRQEERDFAAAVTRLRSARCDAVLLVSLPGVTERLLGAASQLGFEARWIALMPGWHPSLARSPLTPYYERNLWVVWDGPEWGDTTVIGMRNLLDAQRRFRPTRQPDPYHLAGWAMGRVVHLALEKAASLSDMSRAGVTRAVSEMGDVTFEGLLGTYRYGPAETREPPRTSTIFRVNGTRPVGLEAVALNYVSSVALDYKFARRSR